MILVSFSYTEGKRGEGGGKEEVGGEK